MVMKKTLGEKAEQKLKTLTDDAITVVRRGKVTAFTRGWLGQQLGLTKVMTSKVVTQLQKDQFLEGRTANFGDFADPRNRGKYFMVREFNGPPLWVSGEKEK